ncbi:hypothetical protein COLO4_00243 [Corchorus olitorius]|uniref:Uncharacterized protein n=1 Tax=Corchorus olitorius TaxID=93759 RepID=A0A1R3L489_9ROSI|nr:hypothetical protein COLO4_00243 [Corchorus olitorius]
MEKTLSQRLLTGRSSRHHLESSPLDNVFGLSHCCFCGNFWWLCTKFLCK